jgi:hypothetical protein
MQGIGSWWFGFRNVDADPIAVQAFLSELRHAWNPFVAALAILSVNI